MINHIEIKSMSLLINKKEEFTPLFYFRFIETPNPKISLNPRFKL